MSDKDATANTQESQSPANQKKPYKRSIKNYFIKPKPQMKYCGTYMVIIGGTMLSWAYTLYYNFNNQIKFINLVVEDTQLAQSLVESVNDIFGLSMWHFTMMIFVLFAFVVVLSHQFFGPAFALERFIKNLSNGEFEKRVHLRNSDQLKELADELNLLAEKLENSKST